MTKVLVAGPASTVFVESPHGNVLVEGGGGPVFVGTRSDLDALRWRGKLLDPATFGDPNDGDVPRFDEDTGRWVAASPGALSTVTWDNVLDTPTTLAGYGITDAYTKVASDARFAPLVHTHAAGDIVSGTLADARIAASNVTQHQAALAIGWGQLTGVPATFAPSAHTHPLADVTGFGADGGYIRSDGAAWLRVSGLAWADVTGAPAFALDADLDAHIADLANPHQVTKAQVGLGNAENTALSTWAGSANITTLGTIATGVWNATAIAWAKVDKAGSSLADLATRSAADLSSGVLADARVQQSNVTQHQAALSIAYTQLTFSGLTAGQVLRATGATTVAFGAVDLADTDAVTGLLPWANVDKTGSSLADLATRSASDLASGNLAYARLPTGGGTWANAGDLALTGAAGVSLGQWESTGQVYKTFSQLITSDFTRSLRTDLAQAQSTSGNTTSVRFQALGSGAGDSGFAYVRGTGTAGNAPYFIFGRIGAISGSLSTDVTLLGDAFNMGIIAWVGADGVDLGTQGARVQALTEGTPAAQRMPTKWSVWTAAGAIDNDIAEKFTVGPTGHLGIVSGARFYWDGVIRTGDTWDSETSLNVLDRSVGGTIFRWTTTAYGLSTNDAAALGAATLSWSDLFLASGAVVNFNNGDYTATHSAGLLALSGKLKVGGNFACNGQTPAAPPDYTVTNPTTNRSLNVTGATLAQGMQVLGTVIADLIAMGVYQ